MREALEVHASIEHPMAPLGDRAHNPQPLWCGWSIRSESGEKWRRRPRREPLFVPLLALGATCAGVAYVGSHCPCHLRGQGRTWSEVQYARRGEPIGSGLHSVTADAHL